MTGRAAQTTVTITGKVKEIGGTKVKGSCSFTGTRDERPVSGSCTIVFTGKEQDDGARHTTSATLTYTGTGRLHRLTAERTPTIQFPSAPSVDLGKFTFGAKGRGSSFLGGSDDGQGM